MEKVENPKRLCTEIQLFDICSKNSCKYKDGRYCTEGDILARFEAISDEEDTVSNDVFLADEIRPHAVPDNHNNMLRLSGRKSVVIVKHDAN